MSGRPLLEVRGVKAFYGNIMALGGVELRVDEGEIVTLIGANGAGKSTLMMTICGTPPAREGRIIFDGRDITHLPTHEIVRARIAQALSDPVDRSGLSAVHARDSEATGRWMSHCRVLIPGSRSRLDRSYR